MEEKTMTMATANQPTEDLICGLCLEFFNKPKQLSCSHVFCEDCLGYLHKARSSSNKHLADTSSRAPPAEAGSVQDLTTDTSSRASLAEAVSAQEEPEKKASNKASSNYTTISALVAGNHQHHEPPSALNHQQQQEPEHQQPELKRQEECSTLWVPTYLCCPTCSKSTFIPEEGVAGLNAAGEAVVSASDKMRRSVHGLETTPELTIHTAKLRVCEKRLRAALDRAGQAEVTAVQREREMEREIRERVKLLTQRVLDASVKALISLETHSKKDIASLRARKALLTEKLQTVTEAKKDDDDGNGDDDNRNGKYSKRPNNTSTQPVRKEHLVRMMASAVPTFEDGSGAQDRFGLFFKDEFLTLFNVDDILRFIGQVTSCPLANVMNLVPADRVQYVFSCGTGTNVDVFALCPATRDPGDLHNSSVWVAYGTCSQPTKPTDTTESAVVTGTNGNSEVKVALFTGQGQEVISQKMTSRPCVSKIKGRWVIAEGKDNKAWFLTPDSCWEWVYSGPEKQRRLYSKGLARYYLCVHKTGLRVDLRQVVVKDEAGDVDQGSKPPKISGNRLQDVALNALPLAMDVSKDGAILAVIEENHDVVLLFHNKPDRSAEKQAKLQPQNPDKYKLRPFAVFPAENITSNVAKPTDSTFGNYKHFPPIKPRDVCFCVLGQRGNECLVVADWLNDALLVLRVKAGESCDLIGQICGGSPLLVKPMSLVAVSEEDGEEGEKNTERGEEDGKVDDKLWMGCEGGNIVVVSLTD